ncbi:MAG: hypothetical protein GDA36_06150, partial [Rhodobacteraceae bacterium]|nr:hypothetical protein [Paracoccaceae bacterium]
MEDCGQIINLVCHREAFRGWFDAPALARFVSNANRIGTDDVLIRIDVPVDWRWCLLTCKRTLECSGIGPQGYDPLVGQWCPEAGARALNCGWISCCFAAPASLHLCPMRRTIAVFATHDDLLAGVCRQIGDYGPKRKPPTI